MNQNSAPLFHRLLLGTAWFACGVVVLLSVALGSYSWWVSRNTVVIEVVNESGEPVPHASVYCTLSSVLEG